LRPFVPDTTSREDCIMTLDDMREFSAYLRSCTDDQVRGVYEKETAANRAETADLASEEARRRKLDL
jgi:hypothetical protein